MPGDDAKGLFHDWVMSGVGIGAPRSTVPDDAAPTPGHLILRAQGYLAIDWRQVEDNAGFTCLEVDEVERLLHEMLALVSRDILRLIQVSLEKERKVCMCASGSRWVPLLPPPVFASAAPDLR
jgi:hypothetical protein